MKGFAELYARSTARTRRWKSRGVGDYCSGADAADAAWAVYFLSGNRRARPLRAVAAGVRGGAAGIPMWLFEECYATVGDLAETIALCCLLLPGSDAPLHQWMDERLLPLPGLPIRTRERLRNLGRARRHRPSGLEQARDGQVSRRRFGELVMRAHWQVSEVDADASRTG